MYLRILIVLLVNLNVAIQSFAYNIFRNSLRSTFRMSTTNDNILRQVDKWACVKFCGACCKLGPIDSRPDLAEYLDEDELNMYKSMIAEDDWCKHFDKTARLCTIYDKRPEFCRVEPAKYKKMFDVEEENLNDFCAFCCREQINDVYGEESDEKKRFEEVNLVLNPDGKPYEWYEDEDEQDLDGDYDYEGDDEEDEESSQK